MRSPSSGETAFKALPRPTEIRKKQAPAHHGKLGSQQFINCGQIVRGLLRNQGVHLNGKAQVSGMASCFDRTFKCSTDTANGVVPRCRRSIKAETEALNSVLLQLSDGFIGQLRRCARRDRDFQSKAARVV